jgi:acetyl-CoA C-acetyltransferase/acetyl-CoA acyltransferase
MKPMPSGVYAAQLKNRSQLNVNGGSSRSGHPIDMTDHVTGHLLIEGRRRHAKYGVVTMCIGGGMGAAGLFEIVH